MPAATFDPTRYPRTYRRWILFRLVSALFGALLLLGAIASFAGGTDPIRAAGMLLLAAVGAALLILPWRDRIVLGTDFLETRGIRTRRIERAEISSYRRRSLPHGGGVYVVNLAGRPRPVTVRPIKEDADFKGWFAGLSNANAADLVNDLKAIAADDRLGATPKDRLDAATHARSVAKWAVYGALALMIWTILYPHPRAVLLLLEAALVPLVIVVAARSNGLYSLDGMRNSGRGDLSTVMGTAYIALGFRAWVDVSPVRWTGLVVASVLAGVALAAIVVATVRSARASNHRLIFGAIGYSLYAAGVLALINGEFDTAPGKFQLATITEAHKTSGRYSATYFTLSQVPADVDSTEFQVPLGFYQRHHVGDPVCLRERDGALGWHWVRLWNASACPQR